MFNSPGGDQKCTYVDINGDGFNDIAIAIPGANSRDGMIIVVFGHSMTTPFPDIDLSTDLALAGVGFKVKENTFSFIIIMYNFDFNLLQPA